MFSSNKVRLNNTSNFSFVLFHLFLFHFEYTFIHFCVVETILLHENEHLTKRIAHVEELNAVTC